MNQQTTLEERPIQTEKPEERTSSGSEPLTAPQTNKATEPHKDTVQELPGSKGQDNGQHAADPPQSGRPPWLRTAGIAIGIVVLVAGAIYGWRYLDFASKHASTDDAYLTTDLVQITPQVNGNIQRLLVQQNAHVKKGQLLFQLDDSTFRAELEQAKANLEVARAGAQGASTGVTLTASTSAAQRDQARGGVDQARSGIEAARADVSRTDAAVGQSQADAHRALAGITSARAGLESARANVETVRATLEAAQAARRRSVQAVRAAQAQVATAQAGVKAAQSQVASAQSTVDRTTRDEQRYNVLFQQDAISSQQVDAAATAATSARAQLDSARQAVSQAQSNVESKQADLASSRDAVAAADATVSQARAQLLAAADAVNAAQANVAQAQAQYAAATQTIQAALAQRRASQQNVNAAVGKLTQAQGQVAQADTAPQQVSVQRANVQTAKAKIAQAEAALRNAEINLQRTRVVAPTDGRISADTAEVGQQVAIGQNVMSIVPDNDIWVVGNFKETQLKDMREGQPAEIEVDTFPGKTFTGRVGSIAAATGATFSLLPPDNATGNFTKVVQRVPVKVFFDNKQAGLDRLRGGLSAVVTVKTK